MKALLVVNGKGRCLSAKNIKGKRCLAVVPRELFLVDKVWLPEIALENRREVASYQARRSFEREDLIADLYPVSRENSQCQCLLYAVPKDVVQKTVETMGRECALVGVTLASVALGHTQKVESGAVIVRWESGWEVCVFQDGKVAELFWIEEDMGNLLESLKKRFPEAMEADAGELSGKEVEVPDILIRVPAKKRFFLSREKVAWAVVATVLLIPLVWLYRTDVQLKGELEKAYARKEKVKKVVDEYKRLSSKKRKLEESIASLEGMFKGLDPIDMVYELSMKVPEGTVFSTVNIKEKKMHVSGYTDSVSQLIERVSSIPWVSSVKIHSSTREIKAGKYSGKSFFSITLEIAHGEQDKKGKR